MASLASLQEFKTAKGIETTNFDAQITSLLTMISDVVEKYCNKKFSQDTYTERKKGMIDPRGMYMFIMKNTPIDSITSVTMTFYGVSTPISLDVSKLDIFSEEGYALYTYALEPGIQVIREEHKYNFYYDIEYVGGSATTPEAVKLAVIHATSDMFNYYYGDQMDRTSGEPSPELSSITLGDYSEKRVSKLDKISKFTDKDTGLILSQTVKSLLAPYKAIGQGLA